MTTVAIVYHSGFGHTKLQAEAVAAGANGVSGVTARLYEAESAADQLEEISKADAIVLGAPTYMGSTSAKLKAFMEATSKLWFGRAWKDKIAAGFSNGHSLAGDKAQTINDIFHFAMQHGMIWVGQSELNGSDDAGQAGAPEAINRIGGYAGAYAQSENAEPGPNNPPKGDIETAKLFGARIAEATRRWG